ncbi:MAG: PQQ-binding-like beta-propeller repeat protein [Polyangiaceae bacterium]
MIRARSLLCAVGVAGSIASAFLSGGCSRSTSAIAENPVWLRHPSGALAVVQRRAVTDPNRVIGEDYERGKPEIDPKNRRVFVGSSDRGLYALRADDMTTIWRYQAAGVVQSEPLYDGTTDVVYFGSNDGALYRVRASDGSLLWRFSTNAEVSRRPVLQGGRLFVSNANDTVFALDPEKGTLLWQHHRTPAGGIEIASHAGPAVVDGRVFISFSDGRVSSFSAESGRELWNVDLAAEAEQVSGEIPRQLDADATPVVARVENTTHVYVASYAGGVHSLDAETGSRNWSNDKVTGIVDLTLYEEPAHTGETGSPVPARRMLIATGSSGIWALSLEDGRELWRRSLPEGGATPPVPLAGALLVATSRYGLFLLSPIHGAVIDGIETGSGFAATPAAFGRRAYAFTNQGILLGIHVNAPMKRR